MQGTGKGWSVVYRHDEKHSVADILPAMVFVIFWLSRQHSPLDMSITRSVYVQKLASTTHSSISALLHDLIFAGRNPGKQLNS